MSKPRGGLGRGLAALIPTSPQTTAITDAFMNGRPAQYGEEPAASTDRPPPARRDRQRPPAGEAASSPTPPAVEWPAGGETSVNADAPRYADIPIGQIRPNPRNPRSSFDEEALAELEHSVREFGLLQPIVVRPAGSGYELVMGERRWRAAQQAGLTTIPAIIRRTEDASLLRDALLENIHRANLNPLEEAAAYQQLLEEFDVTQDELAARLGRSRPVISNTIRLLRLPVAVQRRVAAGVLSAGHARALLSLDDANDQEELATRVVAEGLSVRGTEEAVLLMAGRTVRSRRASPKRMELPSLTELAGTLSDTFDTRVRVELGRQKGRMVVEFASVDDLERIVGLMAPEALHGARRSDAAAAG
jgi:ParB family chromosome partitioning protein